MISNENRKGKITENKALTSVIPSEFLEANWRLWSFVILLVVGIYLMITYPVKEYEGLVDPFYSPTVLILPLVGLFRLTCYAYRKDYHRHIFNHPRACEVGFRAEYKYRPYTGETRFFRIENLHRWFMYVAVVILPFFYYDLYLSIVSPAGSVVGPHLPLATIFLAVNTAFVTLYTFGCHAIRHLIGGNLDCYSCGHSLRGKLFRGQSVLNAHHETWAWLSLSMFFFVDLYLRAVVAHVIPNIILLR
ncbi:MAG TPA: hypothetical protein VKU79_03250 [Thermoplasmataceae archaeon]|nr:hypothetical protein [Thermoplasmatales archaeon AK]HLH85865.1 hypothetical protein [Thermoplasmataceae archaeon]